VRKARLTWPKPVRAMDTAFIASSPGNPDSGSAGEMAERAGFEPAIPIAQYIGFRDRRLQPLGHLSVSCKASKSKDYNRKRPA
jgi:hypothetical protein